MRTKSQTAFSNRFVAPWLCHFCWLTLLFAISSQCLGQGGPPVILTQPQGRVVGPGSSVTLSVAVSSITAVTYQWRSNGFNIFGATGTNYAINNAQTSANYSVAVTNAAGSI